MSAEQGSYSTSAYIYNTEHLVDTFSVQREGIQGVQRV